MSNIIDDLNIDNNDYKEYTNYIANLSNENEDYNNILKSLSTNNQPTFNLNNSLNTINLETIDSQLFNQLQQEQKNFKTQLKTYNLVIYGGDRPWMVKLSKISDLDNGSLQHRNGIKLTFGGSSENLEGTIKIPIYENNTFIPPSLVNTSTYNSMYRKNDKGFCWNGLFYPPYNPVRKNENGYFMGLGKKIGYDTLKQNFYGPQSLNCYNRFINVSKIELIYILCPLGEHYLYEPLPNETKINKYKSNICQYPYILLNIEEFNTEIYGSDSKIDNSFAVLKHVDQELSTIQLGTRNFIKFLPISGGNKQFSESPLAELSKLTITLKTPEGKIIDQGKDGLKINKYKVAYAIPEFDPPNKDNKKRKIYRCTQCNNDKNYIESGELSYFPKIGNYKDYNENEQKLFYNAIIVIQLEEYAPIEQFSIGDNIVISDFYPSIFSSVDRYFNEYTFETEIEKLLSYLWSCIEEHKPFDMNIINIFYKNIIKDYIAELEDIDKLIDYIGSCLLLNPRGGFTNTCNMEIIKELITKILQDNYTINKNSHKNTNPYFINELISFKEWMNRPEGHKIIWTDSYNTDDYDYYFDTDDGNKQLGINTLYFYGPIDNEVKKKNNIIKCYNWFEKLITQGVSTAKKYHQGTQKNINNTIPFLSNQYWTELIKSNNRQNKSLDREEVDPIFCNSRNFIGKQNPLAIYRSIDSQIFGSMFLDTFDKLSPQLLYYAFYFIELETVSRYSELNSVFNNPVLFNQSLNINTTDVACISIPILWQSNISNYCMIFPDYFSKYFLIDFTYWIDKFKFGSVCNMSLQNTYVFKITCLQADTEILYSKIKNII